MQVKGEAPLEVTIPISGKAAIGKDPVRF